MPGNFFDTNILAYTASADLEKAATATRLIRAGGVVSVQVLNELANVARRKMRLSWSETRELIDAMRAICPVSPLTLETHLAGLRLAERYSLSIHDSMIIASALEADCDVLWSEDMHDGLVVEGRLRIANPFGAKP